MIQRKNTGINCLTAVEDNIEGFSTNQVEWAEKARRLLHAVGVPNLHNFKMMIKGNMIKNCPVMADDVETAERIWGKDVLYIKGRTVQRTPSKVVDDTIQIPLELYVKCRKIILHMDIMYINGNGYLTTIGHSMYYRTCVPLPGSKIKEIYAALDTTIRE